MDTSINSAEGPSPELFYCSIDFEMLPIDDFKVLNCGHCFCKKCLLEWANQGMFNCPKCRAEERRGVDELCGVKSYAGPLFVDEPAEEGDKLQIYSLLHKQLICRAKTIRILRTAVEEISKIEQTGAGVKLGGAIGGLVSTGLVIGGSIAALTVVGAPVGPPLALAGAALGGASGLTVGGGVAAEAIWKNKQLKGANEHLNADYFGAIQLRILLGRAAKNPIFAKKIDFPAQDAASLIGIFGRVAKFSTASVAFTKAIAAGLARGVKSVGLHIAGIVISVALIPIDLYQLITSSIKINTKGKSKVVKDLERLVDDLENELFKVLKDREYKPVELKKFDHDKNEHTLLLAVEKKKDDIVNISYEDVTKNYIVLLDVVCDEESAFSNFIEKWDQIGAL